MATETSFAAFCPRYHRAVELIGRRWSGAILRAMLSGAHRFSQLSELIPGVSDRLLSERLKEFEAEGLLVRTVIAETPVRIEYHLTEKGYALLPVVEALATWAEAWIAPVTDDSPAGVLSLP
ncbi:MAG: helix-turn-helix domain-containing protein [Dehalococcoidia bacterium]|nr:helix-turn-helix transcriptional regulator [Dehalococcoidia bacterium]